ncbi:MAG: hypothetical protein KF744_15690 [Taibaiella sp.]|nr:hypothetical protein [Taibaiella sp.]
MVYDLPVSGTKVKPQQLTALHLFSGLAFLGTGAILYRYNFELTGWGMTLILFGLTLMSVTIVKNKWLTGNGVNVLVRIVELLVAISIALLSFREQWKFPIAIFSVLVAVLVFSLYWERGANQQLYVSVDEAGVHMPVTSRKRFVPWVEADQVLLRYGILSIDCLDNKLYQFNISGPFTDIDDFNNYCAAKVAEYVPARVKNEW